MAAVKKTPKDATEFDREQLRFFLANTNVAAVLAEMNPSLAWLPILAELRLVNTETQLAPWIERNFTNPDAVRDVAANIRFFRRHTADVLDFRLSRTEGLPSLLLTCWRLIIRHMRNAKVGALRDEWFDIAPGLKAGERSQALLEQLADVLRPKVRVGKRLSWSDENPVVRPEQPSDLISIDYETEEHLTGEEVVSTWPENAPPEADARLLILLTQSLNGALEDAIDAGVETTEAFSLSDSDVPSVAKHKQNAHRRGFLPIVRVIADIWTRLARKDSRRAGQFVKDWHASPFKLTRRLALFAAADSAVAANLASETLIQTPPGVLFLGGASVEVYRLIAARWRDFAVEDKREVESRIAAGPPADWFREDHARHVDRCRFDLLGHLERIGIQLGSHAQNVLNEIRSRWPKWQLRAVERAGFHSWMESSSGVVGDPRLLDGVPADKLVAAAKKAAEEDAFSHGDVWRALCQTAPLRALEALEADAAVGSWPASAWEPFLWSAKNLSELDAADRVGLLLLRWPKDTFSEIATGASWWLNESANKIGDDLFWRMWDRIAEVAPSHTDEPSSDDLATASLNHPAGRLAEVLLQKIGSVPVGGVSATALQRLQNLLNVPGTFGRLVRVRLAAWTAFLFERAPDWTKEHIVPLFEWSSADATAMWSARKYANYIGSPTLFQLTKRPLLQLFARPDASPEDLRVFSDWLVAVAIANQSDNAGYPITSIEIRSALRHAAAQTLPSVGHRLALEMERAAPSDKTTRWRKVIGPVFQSIWPLDVDLQSPSNTFKLVQLLRASGDAFPEAAEMIIPFVRPEGEDGHTSVYSISEADEVMYSSSPERLLDLLAAVVGEERTRKVFGIGKALDRLRRHAPQLASSPKLQRLLAIDAR